MDRNDLLAAVQSYKASYERDALHILNLAPGMPHVHPDTPVAEARRNYMKIAALIHPDKFSGQAALQSSATEAFQVLVKVFEYFASPNFRRAAAQATNRKTEKTAKPTEKKTPARKKAPSPLLDESEDEESDDDTMEALNSAVLTAPKRPAKEVISRNRSNEGCSRTTVKCPRCTTAWQPDDNKQYSLFMGYGLRIHCQLCLLLYGCATAVHACTYCSKPFDFDASQYDSKVPCQKCKKTIGFMYYPVTGEQVNKIREDELKEEAKRRDAEEREARARARGGPASSAKQNDDDHVLSLVGKCVVDEECPICGKRVASKHRSHVEACLKNPPPPKKTRKVRKFIEDDDESDDDKPRRRRAASSKPSRGSSLASKKTPAPKRAVRRKRGRDDDSDDD